MKITKIISKLLTSLLLIALYACGSGESTTAESTAESKATTELPSALQKLVLTGGGTLNAYVTIDGDIANRIKMKIDTGTATASASISGLSLAAHTIYITYEYVYSDGKILTLATVSKTVGLSAGPASISIAASEYDTRMDNDGDGASNVAEMAAGSDPRVAAVPGTAALPTLSLAAVKAFRFSWTDVGDATYYRLMENPDGISGFTQVGSNIPLGTQSIDHVVPLYARVNAQYMLESCNVMGCTSSASVSVSGAMLLSVGYVKASNTGVSDFFGRAVSLSADGNTLAVGAYGEAGNTAGVNGSQADNSAVSSGAVYVYSRKGSSWSQQAYIKAGNAEAKDFFGRAISLSADGNTLVVGAYGEDSNAVGVVNGNQADNSAVSSGAAYVYSRSGSIWSQQAYIKASNTEANDFFGRALSLSADGNTLGIGAYREDSAASGVGGSQINNTADLSGAVYVFSRSGSIWSQQAYIKASNTEANDNFGYALSLNADGSTLAVGAYGESGNAIGINGNQADNSAISSGAVYVYSRSGSRWSQQSYIKASNTEANDFFGRALSLSADGNTLAVGADGESSNAISVNGGQKDNSAVSSGAVYVYSRSGSSWSQQAYIKASNTEASDFFGRALSLSADGNTLVAGAYREDSNAIGVNGSQADNSATSSGAIYVYSRSASLWSQQQVYIKASNSEASDFFGKALSLSADGNTLAVGAYAEAGNATGVNGNQADNSAASSGAVYLY